MGRVVGG